MNQRPTQAKGPAAHVRGDPRARRVGGTWGRVSQVVSYCRAQAATQSIHALARGENIRAHPPRDATHKPLNRGRPGGVTYRVTREQQDALDCYDALLELSLEEVASHNAEVLATMAALAASIRPVQASIEELFDICETTAELATAMLVVISEGNMQNDLIRKIYAKTCERKGWGPA